MSIAHQPHGLMKTRASDMSNLSNRSASSSASTGADSGSGGGGISSSSSKPPGSSHRTLSFPHKGSRPYGTPIFGGNSSKNHHDGTDLMEEDVETQDVSNFILNAQTNPMMSSSSSMNNNSFSALGVGGLGSGIMNSNHNSNSTQMSNMNINLHSNLDGPTLLEKSPVHTATGNPRVHPSNQRSHIWSWSNFRGRFWKEKRLRYAFLGGIGLVLLLILMTVMLSVNNKKRFGSGGGGGGLFDASAFQNDPTVDPMFSGAQPKEWITVPLYETPYAREARMTKQAQTQLQNYKSGTALMLHIDIFRQGGSDMCATFGRAKGTIGTTPFNCLPREDNWNHIHYPFIPEDGFPTHWPWYYNETNNNIQMMRRHFHYIQWSFDRKPPQPNLRSTNYEHPQLLSTIVVRNPIDRLLSGNGWTAVHHPGIMSGLATHLEWWDFANTTHGETDNYQLRILAGNGCCAGHQTDPVYQEYAKALLMRFSIVLDMDCMDEGMEALAELTNLEITRVRRQLYDPLSSDDKEYITRKKEQRRQQQNEYEHFQPRQHRRLQMQPEEDAQKNTAAPNANADQPKAIHHEGISEQQHPSADKRIPFPDVYQFLLDRNQQDIQVFEWAKSISLVDCSKIPAKPTPPPVAAPTMAPTTSMPTLNNTPKRPYLGTAVPVDETINGEIDAIDNTTNSGTTLNADENPIMTDDAVNSNINNDNNVEEVVTMTVGDQDYNVTTTAYQQMAQYRNGSGLLLNVQIPHQGGSTVCRLVGMIPDANGKTAPSLDCLQIQPQDNVDEETYPSYKPWSGIDETAQNIATVRQYFHMMAWEFAATQETDTTSTSVKLSETDWENKNLVSVLVIRDPMNRFIASSQDPYVVQNFPGIYSGNASQEIWWNFANSYVTNNYALGILTGPGSDCCQGKDTSTDYLKAAEALVDRFTFVLDMKCLVESLQVMALLLNIPMDVNSDNNNGAGDEGSKDLEKIPYQEVYYYLLQRNRLDMQLYDYAKRRSLVDCSSL